MHKEAKHPSFLQYMHEKMRENLKSIPFSPLNGSTLYLTSKIVWH
jgi:hypothetical protein